MKQDVMKCPAELTIDVIGGRWKALIVWVLLSGPRRLSDLKRGMEECSTRTNISQRMIIRQLRELEEHGVVNREVFREVPPRVEYSLTPLGYSLRTVLDVLCQWGKECQAVHREEAMVETAL
ncbi:MAG: winged helix-turn-helix transcriptional regulator [Candidatus Melainabacteria bacterium]